MGTFGGAPRRDSVPFLHRMSLSFQHLTSTKQLSREDTDSILEIARQMEDVLEAGGNTILEGKILANLFYEPSTRTRLSFETAMHRLGGKVISAVGMQFSSLYKGETIEDTMKVVGQYADIIVMRHPEKGSADRAAAVCPVPFINAGDGPAQHPTQALLDLFTILKERGKLDGIHITMVGDLKFGRTVHSLSFLLGLYNDVRFTLVAPKELPMPDKLQYILEARHLKGRDITVMHPLPRIGEIATDVDPLTNAAYFRQARNGLIMRMALLAMLLKKA